MINVSNLAIVGVRDAAKRLKVSVRRVQQFCREGRLGQLVDSRYIIPVTELERFSAIERPIGKPASPKSNRRNNKRRNKK